MKNLILLFTLSTSLLIASAAAQAKPKYNHSAQKHLLPAELGKVFIGMSLKDFGSKIDLAKAEANGRFREVSVTVPFEKGNVVSLHFKVESGDKDDRSKWLTTEKLTRTGEFGDYEDEVTRIDVAAAPNSSFVYEISVEFKEGFDLRGYSTKRLGPAKDIHKNGDDIHIYDLQWTKNTRDGLKWLIRFHEMSRRLQFIGVIEGTEWDPEA